MDVPANDLKAWLYWLESLDQDRIELGLERVRKVWRRMPAKIELPVVTVAGTNGKGSVIAMLDNAWRLAEYRTAAYTSPHLLRFNERVCLDGQPVADSTLVEAFRQVAAAAGDVPLTYFEYTTLAALHVIAAAAPDLALLEIGLGGRLDAVNLIDADVAVITSIGLDHQHWLGSDRASIAAEKAAVARAGRPLICGESDLPSTIAAYADAIGARLLQAGRDFDWQPAGYGLQFTAAWLDHPLPVEPLSMPGRHQLSNAATALAVLGCPDSGLPRVALADAARAIAATRLPGRGQVLAESPELLLDVAHNEQAVQALVDSLRQAPVTGRTRVVLALLKDKDAEAIGRQLAAIADDWLLPPIPGARALAPEILQRRLAAAGIDPSAISIAPGVGEAVAMARRKAGARDRIVVVGSFITAAELLASGAGESA